ncbi:hypothetical protein JIP62_06945 [Brevundimonas vitis]|uniref:Uncharacterized protein n=1 Tax=Brevundimonas vitisensis TaxID=2800818 RepID=A0ABX7BWD2_9CAUL|nr:hypothetical protein [Brevundimonas vitisensis]QQQ19815.1 hypothetical protein JIP62_06945 [Brevundimonas vitisensis]
MLAQTQTSRVTDAVSVVTAAERALAAAKMPPKRRQSALDKAIAAADAFMQGEYARVRDTHTAAEAAAMVWNDHDDLADEAEALVPAPAKLQFPLDPAKEMVSMELRYADGSSKVVDCAKRDAFVPSDRASLIKHCAEAGLKAKPHLAAWDQWAKDKESAVARAMPDGWQADMDALDAADAAWQAALDKRDLLAIAIMNVRVDSAAEAVRQVEAYSRLMEIENGHYPTHTDALTIAASLYESLRRLAKSEVQ